MNKQSARSDSFVFAVEDAAPGIVVIVPIISMKTMAVDNL